MEFKNFEGITNRVGGVVTPVLLQHRTYGSRIRRYLTTGFPRRAWFRSSVAVAGVAHGIGDWLMFVMPKVCCHLGLQGTLHSDLGELLEQAMLVNQVFGFLVASQ